MLNYTNTDNKISVFSKFFTNENGNSLFKKFKGAFEHIADLYAFHAVVGYFRASGYYAIREHLVNVPEVKILVGINVDAVSAEAKRRGLLFFGDPERTRDEFVRWMREDIQQAAYTKEVEDGIMQFMEDIIDKKIQIRVHKTKKLHAKIYVFLPKTFNEYSGGEVITGSSNLTDAGLGTRDTSNYEFNVALRDYDDVLFAENEFKKLWEEGEEILPFDTERIKKSTHIGQLYTPFEIYIKLLIEYFGKSIDYDPDSVGDLPRNFKKLSYQVEAVNQGYRMLMEYDGFMLADVVGLGKTVIATMVAKRFRVGNGALTTKILVVYPPHLERNWKSTFKQFGLDRDTKFISNGSLHKIINAKDGDDYWPKEDYDLILVDEAHKFRNHNSQMFQQLQLICKTNRAVEGNIKGLRKKVMLISATPLNNRPEDIYYQLLLFTDARKSKLNVTNLQSFFAPLIRRYKEVMADSRNGIQDIATLRNIYASIREKVLQPITVRRTRKDVLNYADYKKDLEEQGIRFPEIADPKAIEYSMDADLQNLFQRTIAILVNELVYYRYRAIEYLNEEIQRQYYTQAERMSRSLAFIMMTQMVKRLESSFTAFKVSLSRFRTSTNRMIEMFDKGKIYIAPDTNINELLDKGWEEEDIDQKILALSEENPRNQIFAPTDFNPEFLQGLRQDAEILDTICALWENVKIDPKWDVFLQMLQNELFRKDLNPSGQLVIFTESKETSSYLKRKLEAAGYTRLLDVSAENRKAVHETILRNFDANYLGEWAHDIDILITTEVLAEGINLHRANMLVNYDTPWNATKMMQRIGRVNRIGSTATIRTYAFYPSRQGDDLIRLYNNAYIKLQGFHTAYGEDSKIYTLQEVLEEVKLHLKGLPEDEDKRLKYLEFIRKFKTENEKEFKRISKLPLKARTARNADLAKKKGLEGSSLVFLKSDYKFEFYRVSEKTIEPLTFVEAASLFEASLNEFAHELPPHHYTQVMRSVQKFEEELLLQSTDTVSGEGADATTNRAKKFLRNEKAPSTDEKFRMACDTLIGLLDKGTFTNLSGEINKLRLKVDKNTITIPKAHNLIMGLAVKYADVPKEDDVDGAELPIEVVDAPDIIISETFQ
jgi:superfamily II DNA/RNA helicase